MNCTGTNSPEINEFAISDESRLISVLASRLWHDNSVVACTRYNFVVQFPGGVLLAAV